mmetsp:Transcript_16512/g.47402  ORF Transcript_16512/g.47402 Transcript_16512/m.47402 type:complete len:222 (-) Transcript_16512:325-990(-)
MTTRHNILVRQSLIHGIVLGGSRPLHLLALLGLHPHGRHARILVHLLLTQFAKQWMGAAMPDVPLVQLLDVGDAVQPPGGGSEEVGVFGQEAARHDAAGMILPLEVGVGEAEEDLVEARLGKHVGHELHGVASQDGAILILAGMLLPQRRNPKADVLRHLVAYFQSQDRRLGKEGGEGDGQAAESATNVQHVGDDTAAAGCVVIIISILLLIISISFAIFL